jgi:nicotinamidase-related amidase
LHRERSRLVLIDVQEKLLPAIDAGDEVLAQCVTLGEGARLFGVPIHITEQYPQGLGGTVADLAAFAEDRPAKKRFSGAEALGWPAAAELEDGRHQVVLAGIEAHVCVLQTAFDLLALGYAVFVVDDAVGSRDFLDKEIAMQRLRDAGGTVTTTEAVLFEWCESAAAAEFKTLSAMLKSRR